MTTDQEIGARVRALRKARKMTLRQVGAEVGLSFTYVGDLERGEKPWRYEHIELMADLFNVPAPLLTDPSVPLDQVRQIAQILEELSDLPPEKLDAVLQMLRAMR